MVNWIMVVVVLLLMFLVGYGLVSDGVYLLDLVSFVFGCEFVEIYCVVCYVVMELDVSV